MRNMKGDAGLQSEGQGDAGLQGLQGCRVAGFAGLQGCSVRARAGQGESQGSPWLQGARTHFVIHTPLQDRRNDTHSSKHACMHTSLPPLNQTHLAAAAAVTAAAAAAAALRHHPYRCLPNASLGEHKTPPHICYPKAPQRGCPTAADVCLPVGVWCRGWARSQAGWATGWVAADGAQQPAMHTGHQPGSPRGG